MQNKQRWLLLASLVGVILVLDQATKFAIHTSFTLHESRPIIENIFALTYVRNPGAAFGLLASQTHSFRRIFFPAITVVALAALLLYFARVPPHQRLTLWGICLIIGGALGNAIDRLWLGQVIDFLDVYWHTYHWPAFNIADSSICIGVGLLVLDALRSVKTESGVEV